MICDCCDKRPILEPEDAEFVDLSKIIQKTNQKLPFQVALNTVPPSIFINRFRCEVLFGCLFSFLNKFQPVRLDLDTQVTESGLVLTLNFTGQQNLTNFPPECCYKIVDFYGGFLALEDQQTIKITLPALALTTGDAKIVTLIKQKKLKKFLICP